MLREDSSRPCHAPYAIREVFLGNSSSWWPRKILLCEAFRRWFTTRSIKRVATRLCPVGTTWRSRIASAKIAKMQKGDQVSGGSILTGNLTLKLDQTTERAIRSVQFHRIISAVSHQYRVFLFLSPTVLDGWWILDG